MSLVLLLGTRSLGSRTTAEVTLSGQRSLLAPVVGKEVVGVWLCANPSGFLLWLGI